MIKAFGLIGPFQPPKYWKGYTSVIMMYENSSHSLFAFIMFPGAYDDVYEIASKPRFRNVFLVPVSLNADYLSDVHRLVTDLSAIKSCVKVIHPERYPLGVNNINELAILRGDTDKCTYTFDDGFISFDFKSADTIINRNRCICNCCTCANDIIPESSPKTLHDIYVRISDKRILLTSTIVDKERILSLLDNDEVDFVYVPYSAGYVTQDTFLTLIEDPRFISYESRLIAYGFKALEEIDECYLNHRFSTPKTCRWVFVDDTVNFPDLDLVIGNDVYCPSVYFPKYEKPPIDETPDIDEPEDYRPLDPEIPANPDPELYELSELILDEMIARPSEDIPFTVYFKVRENRKTVDNLTGQTTSQEDIEASVTDINLYYYDKEGNFVRILTNTKSFDGDVIIRVFGLVNNTTKGDYDIFSSYTITAYAYTPLPVVDPVLPEEPGKAPEDTNDNPENSDAGESLPDSTPSKDISESGNPVESETSSINIDSNGDIDVI